MMPADREMPSTLWQLNQLDVDYADGEGIDFEPFADFLTPEDTSDWIRAWTGNAALDGAEYRIFGQDGGGGYAAIWCVRQDASLADQPIVFFGSEGELGVVAGNLGDYLWLLAGNLGPHEAISYPDEERAINPLFAEFASAHATTPRKTSRDVISLARAEFPQFESDVRALIAY